MRGKTIDKVRCGVAAIAAMGLATTSAFAQGAPWYGNDAILEVVGNCEEQHISFNAWINNCQGTVCDFILQAGNATNTKKSYTITLQQLMPTWTNYVPPRSSDTLNPYQWKQIKLFRSSLEHPRSPIIVLIECPIIPGQNP